MSRVSRRTVVLACAGTVLTGCGDGGPPTAAHRRQTSPSPPTIGAASPPTSGSASAKSVVPDLPVVTAWHPDPGDLAPLCKLTAVRDIERAGNGRDRALQVIDAQYGGLLRDSASVLVVTRSWVRRGAALRRGGHTFDVRLSRLRRGWRVTAIHPSAPGSPDHRLTDLERRVLDSGRITLPPAARADVRSGQVHRSVLRAVLELSSSYRVGVSVVRSGHPIYVFGTTRRSDHPPGRAFDTWRIGAHAVVDPRTPRSLVQEYMHAAAAAGSYNVGGPYLLGAAPQWFSDDTHHDHVHAGFLT